LPGRSCDLQTETEQHVLCEGQLAGKTHCNRWLNFDGPDSLIGGGAGDVLIGGAGADKLIGGAGRDSCRGAGGVDTAKTCELVRSIP